MTTQTPTPVSTYQFLELVFDATQSANERVLGTVAIALVTADHDTETITTKVFRDYTITAENRRAAVRSIVAMPGTVHYIIGGDIFDA